MKRRYVVGTFKGCTSCQDISRRMGVLRKRNLALKWDWQREHALRMRAEMETRRAEAQLQEAAAQGFAELPQLAPLPVEIPAPKPRKRARR